MINARGYRKLKSFIICKKNNLTIHKYNVLSALMGLNVVIAPHFDRFAVHVMVNQFHEYRIWQTGRDRVVTLC